MFRTPRQIVEQMDTSDTDLQRAGRSPRFSADRLNQALKPLRQGADVIDRTVVAPRLPAQGLPVIVPTRARAPVLPARVNLGLGRHRVTHVPLLRAPERFPVASMDLTRRDVGLPYGVPRYVNAATLKAIAGGRFVDRLLKKIRSGWEFVENDAMIDLSDGAQEYRLGRLTIFS